MSSKVSNKSTNQNKPNPMTITIQILPQKKPSQSNKLQSKTIISKNNDMIRINTYKIQNDEQIFFFSEIESKDNNEITFFDEKIDNLRHLLQNIKEDNKIKVEEILHDQQIKEDKENKENTKKKPK